MRKSREASYTVKMERVLGRNVNWEYDMKNNDTYRSTNRQGRSAYLNDLVRRESINAPRRKQVLRRVGPA